MEMRMPRTKKKAAEKAAESKHEEGEVATETEPVRGEPD
jgi:hypothetical protein